MERENHPFVEYLESLRDDRAALAALRRGLGQPPGTVASMYPYVVRWLGDDTPPWQEAAYYLIAALFAYHPAEGGTGNMGGRPPRRPGLLPAPGGQLPQIQRSASQLAPTAIRCAGLEPPGPLRAEAVGQRLLGQGKVRRRSNAV